MQNCGMPPPPFCNLGKRFENTNKRRRLFLGVLPNFGPKTGLNLSEGLFFVCFALHLTFDRKNGLIVDVKIFIQDFLILRFSESPAPPFSKILRTLLATTCYLSGHGQPLKGGESSSQFQWFTIAKIEL